jgi:hypothetical protein
MGPLRRREFQENSRTPTFKKPLKPPLLLFELFVQSEPRAMLVGPRARIIGLAAMLPPGIERTNKPSAPMSAIGGKADIDRTFRNVRF